MIISADVWEIETIVDEDQLYYHRVVDVVMDKIGYRVVAQNIDDAFDKLIPYQSVYGFVCFILCGHDGSHQS